jgi:hypothetical protein
MVKVKCPHRTGILTYIVPLVDCALLCLLLIGSVGFVVGAGQIDQVKKNWAVLRCNPQYMLYYPLLSDNYEQDIKSCVKNIMTMSIGSYLSPLSQIFAGLTGLGINISGQLQGFRGGLDYIRTNIGGVVADFFAYILKILLIFYRFQIAIKQILSRFVGVILSSIYLMRGGVYLGNSTWNGPPGQLVRVLSKIKLGNCFDGNTKIQLLNGNVTRMADLQIGDVLIGNITVVATMVILNVYNEPYYKVSGGVNNEPIYVSGTHYIYNQNLNQYNIVEDLEGVEQSDVIHSTMYCIITSNNLIPVGSRIFWDWEDYKINRLAI